MGKYSERSGVSGAFKLAVLATVLLGIVVVLLLKNVPEAERPVMRTPVTVVVTSP